MGPVLYSILPLFALETYKAELVGALTKRRYHNVAVAVDRLMDVNGLPDADRDMLSIGILEADIAVLGEVMRRVRGEVTLVLDPDATGADLPKAGPSQALITNNPAGSSEQKPLASALVEPFFERRATRDRTLHQVIGQERSTLRRFLEVCGDKPVAAYHRREISDFLEILRKLPKNYGRSPKDNVRSLAEIITAADAVNADRLVDKTVKRHLSALSQFFQFAVDQGELTVAARSELVENHRFRGGGPAREQRDAWAPEDLRALFKTPIWTGSHPTVRSRAGSEIIRDAKFWLPILALYHGARLEEFADLTEL